MPTGEVRIHGFKELNQALKRAEAEVKKGIKVEYRRVAEPVRSDAETLAVQNIRNIGDQWSRMRVGFTASTVYVAPKRRGVKSGDIKRPNLAPLLFERAMVPALETNESVILKNMEDMLDRAGREAGF